MTLFGNIVSYFNRIIIELNKFYLNQFSGQGNKKISNRNVLMSFKMPHQRKLMTTEQNVLKPDELKKNWSAVYLYIKMYVVPMNLCVVKQNQMNHCRCTTTDRIPLLFSFSFFISLSLYLSF